MSIYVADVDRFVFAFQLDVAEIRTYERPPMIEIPEYRRVWKLDVLTEKKGKKK